jgi:hypothetical protein
MKRDIVLLMVLSCWLCCEGCNRRQQNSDQNLPVPPAVTKERPAQGSGGNASKLDNHAAKSDNDGGPAKAAVNPLRFPEAIERAMLMDARTPQEQMKRIGLMEPGGPIKVIHWGPPARQEPPPTRNGR